MLDYSVIIQLVLLSYLRVSNLNLGEMTPDSPRNLLTFREKLLMTLRLQGQAGIEPAGE